MPRHQSITIQDGIYHLYDRLVGRRHRRMPSQKDKQRLRAIGALEAAAL